MLVFSSTDAPAQRNLAVRYAHLCAQVITRYSLAQLLVWTSARRDIATELSDSINPSAYYLKSVEIVVSEMGDSARQFTSLHNKVRLKTAVVQEVDRWAPEKGWMHRVGIWPPCPGNYTTEKNGLVGATKC